ncbi:hypothetical protein HDU86_000052 [Geranomyces michiganensis]|nr:hypothetical protein HDU86_000052 [Geranomyces michiganensis]
MSLNATQLAQAYAAAGVCFGNPYVLQKLQSVGLDGYEKGVYRYGGPGMLVGMCVPVVVINAVIAFWRVGHHANIRAGLLAFASVLNLVDVGNLMVGRSIPYSRINVKAHLSLLIIFGTVKLALIVAASSWRFSAVLTRERSRRWFTTGYMLYSLLWAGLGVGVGMHDVLTKQQASRAFWAICAVLPFTLARTESQTKSSTGPNSQRLKFLRISNNILVGIAFICAATLICVTQTLDSMDNYFVVPTQVLMGSIWLLSEDCFELLALLQTSLNTDTTGVTGGGAGSSAAGAAGKGGGVNTKLSTMMPNDYGPNARMSSAARLPSTGGGGGDYVAATARLPSTGGGNGDYYVPAGRLP